MSDPTSHPSDKEACDHDWKFVDDSFSHEFGTEQVHYFRCELCDAERNADQADYNYLDHLDE
jgi:hypothetical protein